MKPRTLIIIAVAVLSIFADSMANAYVVVRRGYYGRGYYGPYYRGYYAHPYAGAVWVPRHWVWRNGYRVYIGGYWR
jgi:hypothetical protein